MLSNNGKYYLVCNREGFADISNYKLDYITDIVLSDNDIKPATELDGYEKGLDIAKYANENVYMFGEKPIKVTLKLADAWAVSNVIEWFGKNVRIYQKQNEDNAVTFADVTASESAVIYWSLQYGRSVEVMSPTSSRQRIGAIVQEIAEKYNN